MSVEAQWIQIFQGSNFPSLKDRQHGIYPNLGGIELPNTLLSASNYSDLPGIPETKFKYMQCTLRGTGTLAREVNLSKMVLSPLSIWVYSKRKEYAPEELIISV